MIRNLSNLLKNGNMKDFFATLHAHDEKGYEHLEISVSINIVYELKLMARRGLQDDPEHKKVRNIHYRLATLICER